MSMSNGNKNKIDGLNIKALGGGQEVHYVDAKGRNKMLPVENGYYYETGIVLDVIHSPKEYFMSPASKMKIDSFLTENDRSFNFISKIPKNAVLCQIIDQGKNKYKDPVICFPFFPSHISLPIKPGEHTWIMTEVIGDVKRHYWVSRKHAAYHVENVNYTHHERELSIYSDNLIKNTGETSPAANVSLQHLGHPQVAKSGKVSLDPRIIHKSSGYQMLTTEPVPDIVKKPGDLLLQGSNNSIVHMTQEKFTSKSIQRELYPPNIFSGIQSEGITSSTPLSPAIDICVARKISELIEAKTLIEESDTVNDYINTEAGIGFIRNNAIKDSYELNKLPFVEEAERERLKSSVLNDYDLNIKNCGSRIYLSNNCDIDNVFNIGKNQQPKEGDPEQENFERVDPGAVFAGYADHVRFVSDSSFRIVSNFINEEAGNEKSGSTYIEIDKGGKVWIGSIDKNFPSEGGEDKNKGMQPFVKGNELQSLLERLITEIRALSDLLLENFKADANNTPGYGMPNFSLVLASMMIPAIDANLETIAKELNKFKSTLIQGE